LLSLLQRGDSVGMPHSRPMPAIGSRCHELRIIDVNKIWRIIYRIDSDAVVIADVFQKKTEKTPKQVIDACKRRLRDYDAD
jgi:phage-related protein